MTKRANVLTVSLIAIFAVTSVRAEIASKAYVDQQVDSVEAKVDTHTANTTMHITAAERTAWNAKEDVSNKVVTPSSISESDYESVEKYPSMAVVNAMIAGVNDDITDNVTDLTNLLNTKQDELSSGNGGNVVSSGDGNVVTGVSAAGGVVTVTKGTTLGSLATKSEVAEADLASALATKINGKQDKSDSTVSGTLRQGTYLTGGTGVGANLKALDTAIGNEETARANADTAINNKIGTVTEGKTVVQMIQDAQSAATYDDTALAGRVTAVETGKADKATTLAGYGITNAYTKSEVDTSLGNKQDKSDSTVAADGNYIKAGSDVKANLGLLDTRAKANADAISAETTRATTAEGAINTKIGTVTEGKTVVQMIQDAQSAATYDDTALAGRVTATEGAITTLNGDASTTGSVAKKISDAITGLNLSTTYQAKSDSTVAANGNYIKAGSDVKGNLGYLDSQAKSNADAISAETTRATTAEGAINTKIGTVPAGKDVVTMISEAQSAATYDDTALKGRMTTAENAIDAIEASAYATSGITAAKVGDYDDHIADTDIHVTAAQKTAWTAKQDAISDLETIRSGATAGATAVQPGDLGTAATANVSTTGVGANETNLVTGQQVQTAITNLNLGNTYQAKSASTVANGTYNYINQGNAVASNLVALDTAAKNAKNAADAAAATANAALPAATYNTQIGTVSAQNMGTTATTVVGAINEVKTAIGNLDNTYATDAALTSGLALKQDKTDSTATAGNYIAAGTGVGANLGALDTKLKETTDTANAAIPKPSGTCTDCVLHFNGTAYAWEEVGR